MFYPKAAIKKFMIRAIAKSAVVLILCAQLVACQAAVANEQISVEALAERIEQGNAPLILDVRSPAEYAAGHIPGAINIDYREIPNQLETIQAFNSNEVIVYCERGVRANIADDTLTEAGFTSVIQLTGSMRAWRKAELPTVTTETTNQ